MTVKVKRDNVAILQKVIVVFSTVRKTPFTYAGYLYACCLHLYPHHCMFVLPWLSPHANIKKDCPSKQSSRND